MEFEDQKLPCRPGSDDGSMAVSRGDYELPPADLYDPVIEAFKKDVDRTLLVANLRLSVAERLAKFQEFMNFVGQVRGAALPPEMKKKLRDQ